MFHGEPFLDVGILLSSSVWSLRADRAPTKPALNLQLRTKEPRERGRVRARARARVRGPRGVVDLVRAELLLELLERAERTSAEGAAAGEEAPEQVEAWEVAVARAVRFSSRLT